MSNFASFLLGSLMTVICAAVPYYRSSVQLKKETGELRTLIEMLLNTLEQHGAVKLRRDATGKVLGRILEATIVDPIVVRSSVAASGDVVSSERKPDQ